MRTAAHDLPYTDPTVVGHRHGLLSQDVVQLHPGPLRARCAVVQIGPLRIVFHATESRVRTRTSTRGGQVAVVLFGPRARGTVEGLPVRPDLFLAAGPDAEAGFVTEPGWETVTLLLDPASLRTGAAARARAQVARTPVGLEVLRGDEATIRRLFDLGRRYADAAAAGSLPPGEQDAAASASALADVVEAILDTLEGATLYRPNRREFSAMTRHGIVRLAEAHALENAGERVYVSDVCRAVGVSERTLEYAFKTTTGLAPVAYLTALRLHRVRASLQRPAGSPQTVAATASDWGFGHLGDFAQAYRRQFGESPSRTRPAPDPAPLAGGQRADDTDP